MTVDFFKRIDLIYASCSLFCTRESCPIFSSGRKYLYGWIDKDIKQPIEVSAQDYFDFFKRWTKRNLSNLKLFSLNPMSPLSFEAMEFFKQFFEEGFDYWPTYTSVIVDLFCNSELNQF
jgi:MOB kinase activator 1